MDIGTHAPGIRAVERPGTQINLWFQDKHIAGLMEGATCAHLATSAGTSGLTAALSG